MCWHRERLFPAVIVPNSDPTNYTQSAAERGCIHCLAAGTCHQAGYDTVRGDPFFQMDMRMAKSIGYVRVEPPAHLPSV